MLAKSCLYTKTRGHARTVRLSYIAISTILRSSPTVTTSCYRRAINRSYIAKRLLLALLGRSLDGDRASVSTRIRGVAFQKRFARPYEYSPLRFYQQGQKMDDRRSRGRSIDVTDNESPAIGGLSLWLSSLDSES